MKCHQATQLLKLEERRCQLLIRSMFQLEVPLSMSILVKNIHVIHIRFQSSVPFL